MAELVKKPVYKVGDQVRFAFGPRWVGTVTEARGTYLQEGHVFYRVRVPMDPEPLFFELRKEEIEKV